MIKQLQGLRGIMCCAVSLISKCYLRLMPCVEQPLF